MTTLAQSQPSFRRMLLVLAIPVLLLVATIGLFLSTDGAGLNVAPAAPIEAMQFERTTLRPGIIELAVRNTGPQTIELSQVIINDAVWPFSATTRSIPRLGTSVITLNYPWQTAHPYNIAVFSSNSIPFRTEIPVAAPTSPPSSATLLSFTLIGLYVGVIPIFLGMLWLPGLRLLGHRWLMFLMAITAGLLVYLGVDAMGEALELAGELASPFQGIGLIAIGVVATFMLLEAVTRRQTGVGRAEKDQRLTLAFMIALGIGLHNLGEGLAIGAAFSIGAASLGTFLVIGFIIQNITEGLGIITPLLKDRPMLSNLVGLGILGGGPAILGAWVGGLVFSDVLAVVFLAIGAGAVFEVAYEIAKMIRKDAAVRSYPLTIFAGVVVGMLMLYVTGLLIK